ncbi:HlyD family efflux transporter periplasmic adaptor subunit [Microaerobacter geothermalis]|uniref:HlyD family efflux transporter periplasmic adaptor subunit n=1 Tax=Microaerobacter geothermalis TaxID=674972 RepID=UPI001F33C010|nr:HlyD family efflux transporter periplasmic adaptor subunit [Microaerobacter geothermalis]MCF6093396.1 HlyD family efflux transporter periplasmic adaptor subunit [Microaerobacter geothermalis]
MKKRWIIIFILLVVIAVVWGVWKWKISKPVDGVMTEGPADFPPMPTVVVDKGDVVKSIYTTGVIEAEAQKEVYPEVNATVKKVFVQKGAQVNEGDLLFVMDDTEAYLQYMQTELEWRKQYRSWSEWQGYASEIISPYEGRVKEIKISQGDQVEERTTVMTLTQPDDLVVTVPFRKNDIAYIKEGENVTVFLVDFLSYTEGRVKKVDRKGRSAVGGGILYDVTVTVKNLGALYPGVKASVEKKLPSGTVIQGVERGELAQDEEVQVEAKTVGTISQIKVAEGDYIRPGQVIALLDMEKRDLDRVSQEITLKQTQIQLEQQKNALKKYQVTAPISGRVVEVNVSPGQTPESGKPAVVIINDSALYMKASVDEVDIPYVSKGQKVDVYVTAFGDEKFTGEVVEVSEVGKAEGNSVSFPVKIKVESSEKLKPGMTGDADILIRRAEQVLRLPYNAVNVLGNGRGSVMIPGKPGEPPTPKEVEIGVEGQDFIEIRSGLQLGDGVILTY